MYLIEFRAILGHLSEKGEVFRLLTIDCKKGSDLSPGGLKLSTIFML